MIRILMDEDDYIDSRNEYTEAMNIMNRDTVSKSDMENAIRLLSNVCRFILDDCETV